MIIPRKRCLQQYGAVNADNYRKSKGFDIRITKQRNEVKYKENMEEYQ